MANSLVCLPKSILFCLNEDILLFDITLLQASLELVSQLTVKYEYELNIIKRSLFPFQAGTFFAWGEN